MNLLDTLKYEIAELQAHWHCGRLSDNEFDRLRFHLYREYMIEARWEEAVLTKQLFRKLGAL